MEIQYLGHSSFRIKGKEAILVTDPYRHPRPGFKMPPVSADMVTVSHQHQDQVNIPGVVGTTRRKEPFIVSGPGEYEISGVFVYGLPSFPRGNTIYVITMDEIRLTHLGDLGHPLNDEQLEEANGVDILFVPGGGSSPLEARRAVEVINQIEPKIVIPMHFGTEVTMDDFLKEAGVEVEPTEKLVITKEKLPEEREIVDLKKKKWR